METESFRAETSSLSASLSWCTDLLSAVASAKLSLCANTSAVSSSKWLSTKATASFISTFSSISSATLSPSSCDSPTGSEAASTLCFSTFLSKISLLLSASGKEFDKISSTSVSWLLFSTSSLALLTFSGEALTSIGSSYLVFCITVSSSVVGITSSSFLFKLKITSESTLMKFCSFSNSALALLTPAISESFSVDSSCEICLFSAELTNVSVGLLSEIGWNSSREDKLSSEDWTKSIISEWTCSGISE